MFGGFTIIWLIGDTHLGHSRIIDYTQRPFSNVKEMDATIIRNWNSCIKDTDTIIHLVDFCFGDPAPYLKQLKGNLIIVKGNHDKFLRTVPWLKLEDSLCIHRPYNRPYWFDGWMICSHTHDKGKFIDEDNKVISICVEKTGYKPIPFNFIKSLFNGNSIGNKEV